MKISLTLPWVSLESSGWICPGGTIHEDGMKSSCNIHAVTWKLCPAVAQRQQVQGGTADLFKPPLSHMFTAGEAQISWRKPGCACFAVTASPTSGEKYQAGVFVQYTLGCSLHPWKQNLAWRGSFGWLHSHSNHVDLSTLT